MIKEATNVELINIKGLELAKEIYNM